MNLSALNPFRRLRAFPAHLRRERPIAGRVGAQHPRCGVTTLVDVAAAPEVAPLSQVASEFRSSRSWKVLDAIEQRRMSFTDAGRLELRLPRAEWRELLAEVCASRGYTPFTVDDADVMAEIRVCGVVVLPEGTPR